jgi:hypothetical protein
MDAFLLPNGNLLIPKRAVSSDGTLGDGSVEATPDDPDYKSWMAWYERQGRQPPLLDEGGD